MANPNTELFTYCPNCGKNELTPGGTNSFVCSSCDFKFYMNTAAAGIALILNPTGQLLVTTRKKDPAKGKLDFPGGFADPGETMENCLIREVKEELNLDIGKTQYFCSMPNTYLYRDVLYTILDMAFWCEVDDFSQIQAMDDVADYAFADIDHLDLSSFGLDSPKKVVQKIQTIKLKGLPSL